MSRTLGIGSGEQGECGGRVNDGLKGRRLSKKWQAMKEEATVVSSLLYDCQARVWWARDIKRLQSWVDRYSISGEIGIGSL